MEDIATKVEGSILTPEEFNQIPEELENAITSSGQILTGQDTTQLRKAMAAYAGTGASFNVTGSANNLVLTPYSDFQAPIKYYPNQVINFIPSSSNTSSVTISIVGLTTVNLLDSQGQALTANKLIANTPVSAIFNGTNFQLFESAGSSGSIENRISNAVLSYIGDGITYYNLVLTIKEGFQALLPAGRNEDNTLNSHNVYILEDSNYTVPSSDGDYTLLLKLDGSLTWTENYSETEEDKTLFSGLNEFYYNLKDNKTYFHDIGVDTWSEVSVAKVGEFSIKDGVISKLTVKDPVRIDRGTGTSSNDDNQTGLTSFPLFYSTWSDHKLNEVSWLRADTFSWQSGNIYTGAYNELAAEYNDVNSITKTDGDITYKLTPKGYKIAASNQATTISNLYDDTGVAWYYIIDTANKRFKLPRTKYGFVGTRSGAGNYVEESLPNITGKFGEIQAVTVNPYAEGAFSITRRTDRQDAANGSTMCGEVDFDASRSSDAYQDGAPVQQRATEMYLYFYVGNTIINETEIDLGKLSELVNDYGLAEFDATLQEKTNAAESEVDDYIQEAIENIPTLRVNNPFFFGMSQWFEVEPNNASWLLSNGSYHSGTTYASFYEWLTKIQNGTLTADGASVKLSTATGITDYDFVLNTSNTTFRLPIKVRNASGNSIVGNGKTLGLIDGTNNYGLFVNSSNNAAAGTNNWDKTVGTSNAGGTYPTSKVIGVTTDPTKSGIETSSQGLKLYFYVGETIQDANVIVASGVLSRVAELSDEYIVGLGMPDYSAGISGITNSMLLSGYTAPATGILVVSDMSDSTWTIDGNTFGISEFSGNQSAFPTPILLQKGQIIKKTAQGNYFKSAYFFPLKGVN